jgi:hypothetical protein
MDEVDSDAVVRVGAGRGFVVEAGRQLFVITAGHCLPHIPECLGAASIEERTYANLLGKLGAEPSVCTELVFVDPVADLAVLGPPDSQELWNEAEAYDILTNVTPLAFGALTFTRRVHKLPDGGTFSGAKEAETAAFLFSLDRQWFGCKVKSGGRMLWIEDAAQKIVGGMSGSPIITPDGTAVGVVCLSSSIAGHTSGGPNPLLWDALPGWIARTTDDD